MLLEKVTQEGGRGAVFSVVGLLITGATEGQHPAIPARANGGRNPRLACQEFALGCDDYPEAVEWLHGLLALATA